MDGSTHTITFEVEALLTEAQVAEWLGIKPQTLRSQRHRWRGDENAHLTPPWIRVGGSVRYRPSDVAEWIAAREADGADSED